MKRLAVFALILAASGGCRMCASPYDYCGPVYDSAPPNPPQYSPPPIGDAPPPLEDGPAIPDDPAIGEVEQEIQRESTPAATPAPRQTRSKTKPAPHSIMRR
jgi:hypothetical protein